jgi:high-affinity nickel permease
MQRPRQMYGVGLGFDTATEVAVLVLAGTGAAGGLPWRDPVPVGPVRGQHESAEHDRS